MEKWRLLLFIFMMIAFMKSDQEPSIKHVQMAAQSAGKHSLEKSPVPVAATPSYHTILLRENLSLPLFQTFPAPKRFKFINSQKTPPSCLPFQPELSQWGMTTAQLADRKQLPVQNHVQAKANPQNQGRQPVYLTFDDGPNQNLTEILDILKAKHVKATFFMIEPQIKPYQQAVKRLVKEGHYPGLHSVSHDKHKLYDGSPQTIVNEMEQTRKTVLQITGVDSRLTRVPYGSKPYLTGAFRNALAEHHFKMWDWNIDTMDWKYERTNPQRILENLITGLDRLRNQQGPIVILMHVTKGSASELPRVLDYLHSKSYQCQAYNPAAPITMNFWNDGRL